MENTVTAIAGYELPMSERLNLATERGDAYAGMMEVALANQGKLQSVNFALTEALEKIAFLFADSDSESRLAGEMADIAVAAIDKAKEQ